MRRLLPLLSVIVLATAALLYAVNMQANTLYRNALGNYVETARASTRSDLQKLDVALRSIYENIRTLASLPSVRTIERHGENLSAEAKVTFQQIYNNLATSVAVSEVYIVPIDFEPDQMDLVTLKPQEPILMFDQLIVNATAKISMAERMDPSVDLGDLALPQIPEVEIHEYRQLKEHAAWLKKNYATSASYSSLNVPLIGGSEVITCDNTEFIYTGKDADRSGVMFSVPFYAPDGKIKGLITAIILTSALRDLLPASHFALINPGYSYTNLAAGTQQMKSSHKSILAAKPDSSLIYSEIIPVSVHDSRSPWYVWAGLSNDTFYSSPAALSVDNTRRSNSLIVIIIGMGVGISLFFISKHLDQSRALNLTLTKARDLAEKSEGEALASATMFKELNEDITRLNMELSHTAKELREAQSDLIRKAKMEQMGVLVATVAHELRNPLGVVRNSSFALQKKLKESGINESVSLARIEAGIVRCDKIISQFLDFAHSQSLLLLNVDMDVWLEKTVCQAATKYPEFISITCKLGLPGIRASIDSEKMERVIGNLLSNAADAMTLKGQPRMDKRGHFPHITITSTLSPRGIEILIGDNGPGIPADIVEKIREPLFTTKGFGTGLGIPAAEKIIELHSGGLEISSILGEGTSFVIWLPISGMKARAA